MPRYGDSRDLDRFHVPGTGYMTTRPVDDPDGERIWDQLKKAVFAHMNVRWKAHLIGPVRRPR